MSENITIISDIMPRPKLSIPNKIKRLIDKLGPGYVLTTQEMLHLGSRQAIDQALTRLVQSGAISRIGQGLYYIPKESPVLGRLSPRTDQIAGALARQTGSVVQPVGAAAANALGLATQVPARAIYVTDGTPRRRRVGNVVVELKHAGPRSLAGAGTKAGSVLHALRHLGKDHIGPEVVQHISTLLDRRDRKQLKSLIRAAPGWMRPVLQSLSSSQIEGSIGRNRKAVSI